MQQLALDTSPRLAFARPGWDVVRLVDLDGTRKIEVEQTQERPVGVVGARCAGEVEMLRADFWQRDVHGCGEVA